jgi:hypothetical protein
VKVLKLKEIAKVIRSKNAGPFTVTLDIMFADKETYEKVKSTGALNKNVIAKLYNMKDEEVRFFECDSAMSFKASIQRKIFSGEIGDFDIYGAQQHAPLLDIEIPV